MGKARYESDFFTKEELITLEKNGLNYNMCKRRLETGWSVEKAINTPKTQYKIINEDIKRKLLNNGISIELYYNRLKRGYTKVEAYSTPLSKRLNK